MSITAAQVVAAFSNIKNILEQLPKVKTDAVTAAKEAADEQVKASLKDSGYTSSKMIASDIKQDVNKTLVAVAGVEPEKGTINKTLVAGVEPEKGTTITQGGTRAKTYKRSLKGTRRNTKR
jgi:hypothetical protein